MLQITLARLIFMSLVLLVCADHVVACSCVRGKPPCESYRSTSVVFVGMVIKITPVKRASLEMSLGGKTAGKWQMYEGDVLRIRLNVDEVFKGMQGSTVDLLTEVNTAACGFPFKTGQKYLVYAYHWKGESNPEPPGEAFARPPKSLVRKAETYNSQLSTLETNICTRTSTLSTAQDDLALIRALIKGEPQTRVFGRVARRELEFSLFYSEQKHAGPMAGATVEAQGLRGKYEAVTDAEGHFSFVNLPLGKYTIRPVLPGKYSDGGVREVEVTESGCGAEVYFATEIDGRVSGQVFDSVGQPVARDVEVSLVTADTASGDIGRTKSTSAYTDSQGRYEFKGIPPGRYLLGVNIADVPAGNTPFPRAYYPAASDVAKATLIELAEGQKLSLDLNMFPSLRERVLTGLVMGVSGQPVAGAGISLYDLEHPRSSVFGLRAETDSQGHFTIKSFEGRRYLIHAYVINGENDMQSELVEVPSDSDRPLRLVLSKPGYEPKRPAKNVKP